MQRLKSSVRQQIWRVGKIDAQDYQNLASRGKARVRLTDKQPGILTKGLPVLFPFTGIDKAYFMPKIGDRVIVLTDEKCEDGIIIGSIYTKQNLPIVDSSDVHSIDFGDGTSFQYDKSNKELLIDCQGDITIKGKNVFINPED